MIMSAQLINNPYVGYKFVTVAWYLLVYYIIY